MIFAYEIHGKFEHICIVFAMYVLPSTAVSAVVPVVNISYFIASLL